MHAPKMDLEAFDNRIVAHLSNGDAPEGQQAVRSFLALTSYVAGSYDDDAAFQVLEEHIRTTDARRGLAPGGTTRLFYMALPPSVFSKVVSRLKQNN